MKKTERLTMLLFKSTVEILHKIILPFLLLGFSDAVMADESRLSSYVFGATYTGDYWKNTHGGISRDDCYLDLLSLTADLDMAGWQHPGGTVHLNFLIHHNSFNPVIGETQTISNIDFGDGEHLYEMWYSQSIGEFGSSIKAGLYDLNSEFDHIETASLFLGSSHGIGIDFSGSGVNGPSVSPLTSLAVRGKWVVDSHWSLQTAVLDAVPGKLYGENRHTSIHLDDSEGALLATEVGYQEDESYQLALGAWQYTRRFDTLIQDGASTRKISHGAYAFTDFSISKQEVGEWRGFFRIGHAEESVNQVDRYIGTGIKFEGSLLNADDQVGVAVALAQNGGDYMESQEMEGTLTEKTETITELTYRTNVSDWLAIQPDIQHVKNPGTDPKRDNALAVGLRFEIKFEKM